MTYRELIEELQTNYQDHLDEEVKIVYSELYSIDNRNMQETYHCSETIDISIGNELHPLFSEKMYLYCAKFAETNCNLSMIETHRKLNQTL